MGVNWNESAALPVSSAEHVPPVPSPLLPTEMLNNTKRKLSEIFDHMLHLLTRRSRRHCSTAPCTVSRRRKQQQDSFVFNVHLSRVLFSFRLPSCIPLRRLLVLSFHLSQASPLPRLSHFSSSSSSLFPFFNIPLLFYFFFIFFLSSLARWNGMACRGTVREIKRGPRSVIVQHVCPFSDAPC